MAKMTNLGKIRFERAPLIAAILTKIATFLQGSSLNM